MQKGDKYIPWIAVGLAGLILASLGRYIVLEKGGDAGSANLAFIIVIVCTALAYIVFVAFASSITEFVSKLKKKSQIETAEPESMLEPQTEETISEPETIEPITSFVEEVPVLATEPTKPKNMAQLREEVKVENTVKMTQ